MSCLVPPEGLGHTEELDELRDPLRARITLVLLLRTRRTPGGAAVLFNALDVGCFRRLADRRAHWTLFLLLRLDSASLCQPKMMGGLFHD